MRGKTNPHECEYEVWDPANPEAFAALAGEQFLGTEGGEALFRAREGRVMRVPPGWPVVLLDTGKAGEAFVIAPYHLGGPECAYSAAQEGAPR